MYVASLGVFDQGNWYMRAIWCLDHVQTLIGSYKFKCVCACACMCVCVCVCVCVCACVCMQACNGILYSISNIQQ